MEPLNYLNGYKLVEWPDLSGQRNPSRTLHRSSATLHWNSDWPSFHPIIVAAIGRVVGAYCGVSDVLVGSRLEAGFKVVRILWEDTTSWDEVIASVQGQLSREGTTEREELDATRKALNLDANQMSCLALYSLSSHLSEPDDFPFSISFDSTHSSLELMAGVQATFIVCVPHAQPTHINPSRRSFSRPTLIHKISDLSPDLLSLCEPNTSRRDPPPATAMDFLTEQAEKSPILPPSTDSRVPIQPSDSMTYREWHVRSNQFARWLLNRGLKNEDRVAVCMKRDRHFHVSIVGIMRAGGCYVRPPVLPSEPLNRRGIGTTGNPKGCLITHEGLVEAIWAISRIATVAPLKKARTPGRRGIRLAFPRHATVQRPSFDLAGESLLLCRTIRYHASWHRSKSVGSDIICGTRGRDLDNMKLRYICSGGEKVTDAVSALYDLGPYVALNTAFLDFRQVVDDNMNIVVRGGVGELVVGGPLVGRGYHGRPDHTNKVFLTWPGVGRRRIERETSFAASPSARINLDAITILANHPKIGTDQLVSFIAWDPTITISTRKASLPSISALLKACLRAYSTYARRISELHAPRHIVPLQFLPLSSNGKADAKSLASIFRGLDLSTLAGLSSWETDYASRTPHPDPPTSALPEPPTSSCVDAFSRLWLPTSCANIKQTTSNSTLYVQTTILACKPQTSLWKLQQAWQTVASRHQILRYVPNFRLWNSPERRPRAVFYFDRSLVQIILRPGVCALPWVEKPMPSILESDFAEWFAEHEAEGIARYLNENMSHKPLFRLTGSPLPHHAVILCFHSIMHFLMDHRYRSCLKT
ncbi:Non-ribosomal peptide synthetase [Salix suchowensis]|nr:Non-ribosomal peptide synthetase [Salix suchowensis]